MATYKLQGVPLADYGTAFSVFQRFAALNAKPLDELCFQLHTSSLDTLDAVLSQARLDRISIYNWRKFEAPAAFREPEFSCCRSARILAGPFEFRFSEHYALPEYDWQEERSQMCLLFLEYRESKQQAAGRGDPVSRVRECLHKVLMTNAPTATPMPPDGSTKTWEDPVVDTYMFTLPYENLPEVMFQFSRGLELTNFIGSFEFVGDRSFIRKMEANPKFAKQNYPDGLASRNFPTNTLFAVERQNLLAPVPNVSIAEAASLGKLDDAVWGSFPYLSLLRCYLTWRADGGELSRASRGQHLWLFWEKGRFGIEIGVEQYADEDIPVRRLVKPIDALAKDLGGSLKRGRSYVQGA